MARLGGAIGFTGASSSLNRRRPCQGTTRWRPAYPCALGPADHGGGTITGVSVQLNHTIVSCRDQQRSAAFLTGILGLPAATRFAHFLVVEADNGVSLDFAETTGTITPQHYAFLVGEEEFDAAFGRICDQALPYWADPAQTQPQVINYRDGGRGVYFEDPDGHRLEIITRPYGSGS
jgi:catechol 2,3-dioxygenase-like lactoylglutathione lyase family enzyme